MSENSKPQNLVDAVKRSRRSTFVLLFALLLVADVVLTVYLPMKDRNWYEWSISAASERFHRKIFEYICSSNNPQVVILGSSLIGVPALCTDQVYVKGKAPYPYLPETFIFSQYKRAEYLKRLLTDRCGTKVSVVNLGVAGAVISDHLAILEKAWQFNKRPSLVICTIAPVEFMWSNANDFQKTRVRQAFHSYLWPAGSSSVEFAADAIRRELAWHIDCLEKELGSFRTSMADQVSITLHGKKTSAGVMPPSAVASSKAGISGSVASVAGTSGSQLAAPTAPSVPKFGRHATLAEILESYRKSGRDRWGRKNELPDLAMYKRNYANLNEPIFQQHVVNFEKMLELCRKNNIPLVVVNMPLTRQNRELLAKPIYDRYYKTVSAIAQDQGTPFIDMDKPDTFALSDFYDSTHLNDDGGKKFFQLLSEKLAEQHLPQVAAAHPSRTY